ncbi:Pneumococcal vaccine antigen A homolog [Streptococcus macedonicus ACA-DC 198]|uniref:lysozyme family protein n=1 Tax=Streptococcus macedonicus TaxID=59310 RepID=UPI000246A4DE|nr:lysozyme family protein [Streptococcus macedonicus]MCW8644781.1 lysozyme family protein [Streptococcus macedonicus]PHV60668.1 lysozyme family protein [Streptococcus macedonicus]CCF02260.1 Pneumococcal vaccine antigen A homolog [Streptococcus macedonicus ACA-DC 198]
MFKFLRLLIILGFVIFCGYQTYVVHENVQNVLQYKDMVKEILDDNDTTANVDLVLAMIYTETKGDDGDVMQSSESSDGVANSITDSQTSIRQGVTVLSENLTLADEAGVDVWTAVQAYNFGTAYIDYVVKNGGENTIALATAYSRDVVAPSLGNTTGEAYFYYHPLALISGGKLYKNGGNIYYSREVHFNLYLIELMSLF